jgi:hypothetical protein
MRQEIFDCLSQVFQHIALTSLALHDPPAAGVQSDLDVDASLRLAVMP